MKKFKNVNDLMVYIDSQSWANVNESNRFKKEVEEMLRCFGHKLSIKLKDHYRDSKHEALEYFLYDGNKRVCASGFGYYFNK